MTLFAYGTLRDADLRAAVLGRHVTLDPPTPATAIGYRCVYLFHRFYPGLVKTRDSVAEGVLLSGLSAAAIARLDAYEGDEYRRATLAVKTAKGDHIAHCYLHIVAPKPTALSWTLAEWTTQHKRAALAAVIAEAGGDTEH